MKNLSLKMEDDIFKAAEEILAKGKKSRNRYINEAVDLYNRLHKRKLLSRQLSQESRLVAKNSLAVLGEFEKLQDEDQAV